MPQFFWHPSGALMYQRPDGSAFEVPQDLPGLGQPAGPSPLAGSLPPPALAPETEPPSLAPLPPQELPPAPPPAPEPPPTLTGPSSLTGLGAQPQGATGFAPTFARQEYATAQGADLEARRAEEAARKEAEIQKADAARLADIDKQRAARRLEADKADAAIRTDIEEFKNTKIDPNHMWATASTGRKIAGAISLFIGGFLEPVTGKNSALTIINQAIDRDIDAQKSALQARGEALNQKQSLYARNLARYGDEYQANLVTRAQLLENAKGTLQAQLARFDAPAIRNRGEQAVLGIEQQQNQTLEQMRAQREDERARKAQIGISYGNLALGKRQQTLAERRQAFEEQQTWITRAEKEAVEERARLAAEAVVARGELPPDQAARAVYDATGHLVRSKDGSPALVPDKDRAKDLSGQLAAQDSFKEGFAEYRALVVDGGRQWGFGSDKFWASPQMVKAKAMHKALATQLARSYGGPITESDIATAEEVIGGLFTKTSANPLPALDAYARSKDREITAAVRRNGLPDYNPATEPTHVPVAEEAPPTIKAAPVADLAVQAATATDPSDANKAIDELERRGLAGDPGAELALRNAGARADDPAVTGYLHSAATRARAAELKLRIRREEAEKKARESDRKTVTEERKTRTTLGSGGRISEF